MATIDFDSLEKEFKTVLADNLANIKALSQGQERNVRIEFGDPATVPPPLDWLPLLMIKVPHEFEAAAGTLDGGAAGNQRRPRLYAQATGFVRMLNPAVRDEYMSQTALKQCRAMFAQFENLIRVNPALDPAITAKLSCIMRGRVLFFPAILSQSEDIKQFDAYSFQATLEVKYRPV